MNPEKLIKYSVPFFVIAIISRSIEEISFLYYAVPVMSAFFIVLVLRDEKPSRLLADKGTLTSKVRALISYLSFWRSPESGKPADSDSEQVGITGREGITGAKIDIKHLPSSPPKADFTLPTGQAGLFNIFSSKGGFHFAQHLPYSIFLTPGFWFLLTSLWSSYPEVSATRALYFILISSGCISAGVLWIRYSGKSIFDLFLPANILVILICLFSLITNIPSDSWTAGHGKGFIGFFGHQNLLASVLLFTFPAVIVKIKDKSKKLKVFFFILFTLNLFLLILTYSRSAILSLIFGVIVFLILNKNWKIFSYSFISAAVLAIIIYLTPALNQSADKVLKKDFPEIYSSRMWMWEPSYKAALEGGLFGLGYGISHPETRSGEYSNHFENGRLIREKGNSTLALIEETGLIGLVLFLISLTMLIKHGWMDAWRHGNHKHAIMQSCNHSILFASLSAFLLHAQFEAWWVGVGSVQLPLFFVYLGLIIKEPKP